MKTDYLPAAEYEKLFELMQPENVLPLRCSLETGLRIGDVLALKRSNLTQKSRKITYKAQKTGKKGTCYITDELMKKILLHSGQEYLFEGRSPGKPRTRQAVYTDLKKAAEKLHIDLNVAPHSCRKTFAVEDLKKKGSLAAVQEDLQHTNKVVTMLYAYADKARFTVENGSLTAEEVKKAVKTALIELICDIADYLGNQKK